MFLSKLFSNARARIIAVFMSVTILFSSIAVINVNKDYVAASETSAVDSDLLVRVFAGAGTGFSAANAGAEVQIWDGGSFRGTASDWLPKNSKGNWNNVSLNGTTSYWYQEISVNQMNWLDSHGYTWKRINPDGGGQWNYHNHNQGDGVFYKMSGYHTGTGKGNSIHFNSAVDNNFGESSLGYVYKIRLMYKNGDIHSEHSQMACHLYDSTHALTLPTSIDNVPSGYTFSGWYTDGACTTKWDGATITPSADTTLYAGYTGGLSSGEGVYITTCSDWVSYGLNYYVYFFSPVSSTGEAWTSAMTEVPGNSGVFEATVPQLSSSNTSWTSAIVVCNSSASWPGENAKQTQDISLSSPSSAHIVVNNSYASELKRSASLDATWNDDVRAESWGTRFLAATKCDGDIGSVEENDWPTSKNEYKAASTHAQGIIYVTIGNESGTNLQKAIARYDYIESKRIAGFDGYEDFDDFIDRMDEDWAHITPFGAFVVSGSTHNQSPLTTTLWIVLASGLAGLAAIGTAYFVSKKKRHQA